MAARRQNRDRVVREVGEVIRTATTAEWVARLAPLGIVVSGLETMEQALASDMARARGMVVEIPSEGGPIRAVGNPIKIEGEPSSYREPPRLGEHNGLAETHG